MKQILDNKGLETMEWIALGVALLIVVYAAYSFLGAQIASAVRGLAGML
jgi:hypothetical protein